MTVPKVILFYYIRVVYVDTYKQNSEILSFKQNWGCRKFHATSMKIVYIQAKLYAFTQS